MPEEHHCNTDSKRIPHGDTGGGDWGEMPAPPEWPREPKSIPKTRAGDCYVQ